jgi:hypothetical protein
MNALARFQQYIKSLVPSRRRPAPISTRERTSLPCILSLVLIALVIVKLILVSQEEILAFFLPHDDLWQIRASARLVWKGNYEWDTLIHYPLYPLFISLFKAVGLPLRLGFDLFLCYTAYLLARAIWQAGYNSVTSAFVGLAVMFHPASFQLPNRAGAEIMLAPLLTGALACTICWWNRRSHDGSWLRALNAACWWALAWNIRKESILIVAGLGVFALLIYMQDKHLGTKIVVRRVIYGAFLPIFAAICLSTTIKTINYCRWQLFAQSLLTAPGFVSAYSQLQSIPPPKNIPYVPITAAAREQAYQVSPSFAEMRPHLEGPIGAGWAHFSNEFLYWKGIQDTDKKEIAAGWFYWALHDAAIAAGHGQNPKQEDRFFKKISNEIKKAQEQGILSRRLVPMAFLAPDYKTWIPKLPSSIRLVARGLHEQAVVTRPRQDVEANNSCGGIFDREANRRSNLLTLPTVTISGWCTSKESPITSIRLLSKTARPLASTMPTLVRSDIDTKTLTGFVLRCNVSDNMEWDASHLELRTADNHHFVVEVSQIAPGKVVSQGDASRAAHLGIDSIEKFGFETPWTWPIQDSIESLYLAFCRYGIVGILFTAPYFALTSLKRNSGVSTLITFIAVIIAGRVLFFSILDASAWQGNQPRYLFPIMPIFGALVVIITSNIMGAACQLLGKIKNGTAARSAVI